MDTTVRGMLSNFLDMIKQFGFIPNGGRIYYTKRSQPPFFIPMFDLYISKNEGKFYFSLSNSIFYLLMQQFSKLMVLILMCLLKLCVITIKLLKVFGLF